MRIVSSQVALSADQSRTTSTETQVKGRVWVGAEISRDNVRISDAARTQLTAASLDGSLTQAQGRILVSAAQPRRLTPEPQSRGVRAQQDANVPNPVSDEADAIDEVSDEELLGTTNGTQMIVLKRLVEAMTGKRVRVMQAKELEPKNDAVGSPDAPEAPPANSSAEGPPQEGPPRAGWGVQLDVERVRTETARSNFEAAGNLVTEDGRSLSFSASFLKESARLEVERVSIREGDAQVKDPLVLVYSGTTAELTAQVMKFDLDNDGTLDNLAGLANGAYVVADRNRDGQVNDARELLGALSNDGFADLRALDEDGNGFVDEGDSGYANLYAWDPMAAPGAQLTSLTDAGIGALFTGQIASPFEIRSDAGDLQGRVRATGMYVTEDGTVRPMEQIDLVQSAEGATVPSPLDVKA